MAAMLEPKGKLDATSVVNGPEGGPGGWESVSWLSAEGNVRRLRQRIFTASQAGDLKRVRNLQKLMLRSRSNALVGGSRPYASTAQVRPTVMQIRPLYPLSWLATPARSLLRLARCTQPCSGCFRGSKPCE